MAPLSQSSRCPSVVLTLGMAEAADAVEKAVRDVLREGWRTGDIASAGRKGDVIGCVKMGDLVAAKI